MKVSPFVFSLALSITAFSQIPDLPMGKVTFSDLSMKSYAKDTTASAVILNEWGTAHIDEQSADLVFEKYVKIKILKKEGFEKADFSIYVGRNGNGRELFISAVGSTFNLVNNSIKESKLDPKNIFKEDLTYGELHKFTLPDIHEGSVIEVKYKLTSPFVFNFRPWEFQSEIPKVHSEYWALIPGNYSYNITLKGYLRLKKNEATLVKNCFSLGRGMSECSFTKYGMDDIPAFVEEDYMTSKKNFVSAIHFELSEVRHFDGRVDKITKEWKDVDDELRGHDDFGDQIKKARGLLEDKVKLLIGGESDTLRRAKIIYDWVKGYYTWNGDDSKYTDQGVKKAFETRKGNDADINLSLIAALQVAGANAYPLILSTRENGLPTQLHPVMSDFNYVVAYVEIGGKQYFLDATNSLHPFGLLPMRCMNGQGRLLKKESVWVDLKAKDKQKSSTSISLSIVPEGFVGTFTLSYQGYKALAKRSEILSVGDRAEYLKKLKARWKDIEITEYEVTNLDSIDKPLEEMISVKIDAAQSGPTLYFNPFVVGRWEKNPFMSSDRMYPVDFGAPLEEVLLVNLKYPETYAVDELPNKVALALPDGGGRLLFNVATVGNRVSTTSNLTINKAVYTSAEYSALKELFTRFIQNEQSQIVLKKL